MNLKQLRVLLAVLALCCIGSAMLFIFWKQELQYAQPTPVPASYHEVQPGDSVTLPATLPLSRAFFFHFYNPECPCSRFNARHIQSLLRAYGDSIDFRIVVPDKASLADAREAFGHDQSYLVDEDHTLAHACGVYATPQAAIISVDHHLYYRGNYNRSRYCTQRATNFAELALVSYINGQPAPLFGLLASQAYGCELEKESSTLPSW